MSTYQNVSSTVFTDKWYLHDPPNGSGWHSGDPDEPTTVGIGIQTATTLSISDSDEIKQLHNSGYPSFYYYPSAKIYTIQFTTPNDGINHHYDVGMVLTVTGPTPPYPWNCPTCGPGGSGYTTPVFCCTIEMDYRSGGVWKNQISPGYKMAWSWSQYNPYSDYYGYCHLAAASMALSPNTLYRLYGNYSNSYVSLPIGDYFDYTTGMSIFCADFSTQIAAGNLEMICEMN